MCVPYTLSVVVMIVCSVVLDILSLLLNVCLVVL